MKLNELVKLLFFLGLFMRCIITCSQHLDLGEMKYERGVYFYKGDPYSGMAIQEEGDEKKIYTLTKGKFDGPFKLKRLKKIIAEGNYLNGKKHGKWVTYISIDPECGTLTPWEYKYYSGTKYTQEYKNGLLHGKSILSGRKEEKLMEESFLEGEYNGPYYEWYENGQVSYKGGFIQGKKNGRWKHWNKKGKLIWKQEWIGGKLIHKKK